MAENRKLKPNFPKFLQNRDVSSPSKKSTSSLRFRNKFNFEFSTEVWMGCSSGDSSWLFKFFSKLFEKESYKESVQTPTQDKSLFDPKRFAPPTLTVEEIENL